MFMQHQKYEYEDLPMIILCMSLSINNSLLLVLPFQRKQESRGTKAVKGRGTRADASPPLESETLDSIAPFLLNKNRNRSAPKDPSVFKQQFIVLLFFDQGSASLRGILRLLGGPLTPALSGSGFFSEW